MEGRVDPGVKRGGVVPTPGVNFEWKGDGGGVVPRLGVYFAWKGGSTLASTLNGKEEGSSLLLALILNGREGRPWCQERRGCPYSWRQLRMEGRWRRGRASSWRLFCMEGRVDPRVNFEWKGGGVVPPPGVDFEWKGGSTLVSREEGLSLLLASTSNGREMEEGSCLVLASILHGREGRPSRQL